MSSMLSFCHPTIVLFCSGVPMGKVISQDVNVLLLVHHFVKLAVTKKCRGSIKWSHLATVERFSMLCHTL
jgi:hypothetical protein